MIKKPRLMIWTRLDRACHHRLLFVARTLEHCSSWQLYMQAKHRRHAQWQQLLPLLTEGVFALV